MTTFIRVADKITGARYTIPEVTLDIERHAPIEEPAVDANGDPLAATYPDPTPEPDSAPPRPNTGTRFGPTPSQEGDHQCLT